MEEDFRYGSIARGIYIALIWLTMLFGAIAPESAWARAWLPWHILLVLFLGLGLKPLLIRTGLRRAWLSLRAEAQRKRNAAHHAEAARKVERHRRDEKLRKSRLRHPDLPKRW